MSMDTMKFEKDYIVVYLLITFAVLHQMGRILSVVLLQQHHHKVSLGEFSKLRHSDCLMKVCQEGWERRKAQHSLRHQK